METLSDLLRKKLGDTTTAQPDPVGRVLDTIIRRLHAAKEERARPAAATAPRAFLPTRVPFIPTRRRSRHR